VTVSGKIFTAYYSSDILTANSTNGITAKLLRWDNIFQLFSTLVAQICLLYWLTKNYSFSENYVTYYIIYKPFLFQKTICVKVFVKHISAGWKHPHNMWPCLLTRFGRLTKSLWYGEWVHLFGSYYGNHELCAWYDIRYASTNITLS